MRDGTERNYDTRECNSRQGKPNEALVCYQTAITINPAFAAAHSNLASLLKERGPAFIQQARAGVVLLLLWRWCCAA